MNQSRREHVTYITCVLGNDHYKATTIEVTLGLMHLFNIVVLACLSKTFVMKCLLTLTHMVTLALYHSIVMIACVPT